MEAYKIADLDIEIHDDKKVLYFYKEHLSQYHAEILGKCKLTVNIVLNKIILAPEGLLLIDEYIKWIRKPDGGYCIYNCIPGRQDVMILINTDRTWDTITIEAVEEISGLNEKEYNCLIGGNTFFMLGLIVRYKILQYSGFVIHASSIDYNGYGITFSAPSGTGKSTHVNLWTSYNPGKARVINDDTPVIRMINETPYLFGSPWCGSSFKGINASVPLRSMIVLERGYHNEIQLLSAGKTLEKLLPRIMLPYYDQATMETAIGTFEKTISKVPVYLLKCTPEREAMEIVRSCVMSNL